MPPMLIPGQRVVAQSEPELGLGIIVEVEEGTIDVLFPGSEVQRRYSVRTAPLRRLVLSVGQRAATKEGKRFTVV